MSENNETEAVQSTTGTDFPWRMVVFGAGLFALVVGVVINLSSDAYTTKEAIGAVIASAGMLCFGLSFLFPKVNI